MTTCGNRQTPKGQTAPLECACDTDIVGTCHVHETAGGARFIGALDGSLSNSTLVLGVQR